MELAYGLRVLRAAIIGVIIASLWAVIWGTLPWPGLAGPYHPVALVPDVPAFIAPHDTGDALNAVLRLLDIDLRKDTPKSWAVLTMFAPAFTLVMCFIAHGFKAMRRTQSCVWMPLQMICKCSAWVGLCVSLLAVPFGIGLAKYTWIMLGYGTKPMWTGILTFGVPVALLWGPVSFVWARERVLEFLFLQRWFRFGRGGSGRWCGPRSFAKFRTRWKKAFEMPAGTDIYLGRSLFSDDFCPSDIGVRDDAHMLTIGQAGSGKSTTSIWLNLLRYLGAIFVIDPKGEHFRMTSARRRLITGQPTHLLDPRGESKCKSNRHSLLSEIDIKSDHARSMLTAVSDGCVLSEGGDSGHWTEMARLLIEGLIAHVLSTHPKDHHTLPYVFDLVQGINEKGFADPEAFDNLLTEMRMNPVAGGIAQQAAASLEAMGDRERGSVLSTVQRSLKWVSDPLMRKHLSGSDFKLSDIGQHTGRSLYVVVPTRDMKENARWVRVLTNLTIRSIEGLSDRPRIPVLMVLDEFPQYGTSLKAVEEGIVTLRYAKIKLWPCVQNITQLVRDFGPGWQTFVSSATVQVFGVQDEVTANWVSKMLGERLVTRRAGKWWHPLFLRKIIHQTTCPLYTPAEVMRDLRKTAPRQIVFPNNGFPMRLERLAFKRLVIEGNRFRGLPMGGPLEEITGKTEGRIDPVVPLGAEPATF